MSATRPSNLVAYLRPDGFSISSRFPFIDGPRSVPTVYLDVVYDITYRTPSLIAVTPLLFGLGVWGSIIGVRAVRRDARIRRVAFLATVGVPAAATLLIWGFIAPRYLADFLPLLIPLSLLGLGGLSTVLDRSGRRLRAGALVVVAVLGCWSIAAGAALAVSSSYLTGPDGDAAELVRIQGRGSFWTPRPGAALPPSTTFASTGRTRHLRARSRSSVPARRRTCRVASRWIHG